MYIVSVLAILVAFTNSVSADNGVYEDIPQIIFDGVKELQVTQKVPQTLTKAVKDLLKIEDKKISNKIVCQACSLVIGQVLQYRKGGASKESVANFLRKLCETLTTWGSVACNGYVEIETDTILYIIDNKKDLTAARVCSISLQTNGCRDPDAKKWNVNFPLRGDIQQTKLHERASTTNLKILHVTDLHYDALYKPGSNADCGQPLCCQQSNGLPLNNSTAAGYWGDYHVCDTPWHTITDFMKYVNKTHQDIDLVYFTGDIISHKSWATSKDENIKDIHETFQLFNSTFKKIPVYGVLGNHESHPSNFYSPGNVSELVSTQWVFDVVAKEWSWLPAATQDTIKKGGYYTTVVRPGLRVIALNSNVCFVSNVWLLYEDEDPYGQLKWLADVLTAAEKNGEKVHILSHIPPGEIECLQQWANQFNKIVETFAHIIVAQFNGHTHIDELRLFRNSSDPKKIFNVAFNGGSFTPFVGLNPNYRIYDVDGSNYTVLDYDQFIFNLTKANQNETLSPQWYKLYSLKDSYGLNNTSLDSFGDLLKRMSSNRSLLQQYYKFGGRESPSFVSTICDDQCLKQLACKITAVEPKDALQC